MLKWFTCFTSILIWALGTANLCLVWRGWANLSKSQQNSEKVSTNYYEGCPTINCDEDQYHLSSINDKVLLNGKIATGNYKTITWMPGGGGGALNFFSGRGVRPGFPKCGACELTFTSEKGGLWVENFQIWGLVSRKFPNLGACELKFGWKLRLLKLKFPQKGVLWTDSFAWNGTLASSRRGVKRGSSGPHIPIPPF